MITLRSYDDTDFRTVGILIAETFADYNLAYAAPDERERLLGPFRHARSSDPDHVAVLQRVIRAPMVIVAEDGRTIVGVLRGSCGRLHSLFVAASHHGLGVGRQLLDWFEAECVEQGAEKITLASSLYAVPFHQHLGYKKSTGERSGRCFDGVGFPFQPMKKVLRHI